MHIQFYRKTLKKIRVHMLEGNGRAPPPPVEGEKKGERERGKEIRDKKKDIRDISYKQTITTTINNNLNNIIRQVRLES